MGARKIIAVATTTVLVLALLVAPASADSASVSKKRGWQTLRAGGGFTISVPRGYRVKLAKGAYDVTGPGGKMTLLALRTGGLVRTVAEALLGGGLPPTPNANHFGLLVKQKKGGAAEVYFDEAPGGVAVTALTPPKARKGKRRKPASASAEATASAKRIGKAQRRLFARMARSARNLKAVDLPTAQTQAQEPPIPLKSFTTADGSAKAMVPDAPGWVAGGSQGIVEGYHPDLGSYAFGVPIRVSEPWTCFIPPCAGVFFPFMPVQQALQEAWPAILNQAGANVTGLQIVSQIPNSAGILGSGSDSGMFQVSFQSNGKPGSAYVIAGTAPIEPGLWLFYYSYIAAYVGVSGTVGDALLRTWQSWDPSVNQAERQAQTFVTLQETTQIIQSASEYRRRVFEKTNYNWDAYIRGKDPVLDPVAPSAIGEGGQTLVQGADGKLFNFAGNQFKKPGE